jgi:uncharacterized protein YaiE (UPF0345 family)
LRAKNAARNKINQKAANQWTRRRPAASFSTHPIPTTPMTTQFDHVSVIKKANVYFDGKCISHTIVFPDGSKKSIGVIFPSTLTFNTGAPEIMEITAGKCRVKLKDQQLWRGYGAGQRFEIAGNSSFDIEVTETVDYVCHFG